MRKKLVLAATFVSLLLSSRNPGLAASAPLEAQADLINSKNEKIGTAQFQQTSKGVQANIEVNGLTPGEHGIHIHEVGKCIVPDFVSAGSHFNPEGKEHGYKNPKGKHAGDLPNLSVGENGKGSVRWTIEQVTLKQGKNSLLKPTGTALVIHEKPDDFKTSPAGNSGGRIACGVISSK